MGRLARPSAVVMKFVSARFCELASDLEGPSFMTHDDQEVDR